MKQYRISEHVKNEYHKRQVVKSKMKRSEFVEQERRTKNITNKAL